jgi:hypothetical protein
MCARVPVGAFACVCLCVCVCVRACGGHMYLCEHELSRFCNVQRACHASPPPFDLASWKEVTNSNKRHR